MSSFSRSADDQHEYEALHLPGSDTFINKLNIREPAALEGAERHLVAMRFEQGLPDVARSLNYAGLIEIHRHLFQDVYAWAGQERTYATGRGAAPFAPPERIRSWLEMHFFALGAEGLLAELDRARFAERAAFYVNEINAVHPFVGGNGRVQRVWLRNLAEQAGHRLRFQAGDRAAWHEASRIGFEDGDSGPFAELIGEAIVRH
jgi:cell filamentation protein